MKSLLLFALAVTVAILLPACAHDDLAPSTTTTTTETTSVHPAPVSY